MVQVGILRRRRVGAIVFCLLAAWWLSGCRLSHVEAARQAVDGDEPVAGGEPGDDPRGPAPGDGAQDPGSGDGTPSTPGPGAEQGPSLSIADVSAAEDDGTLSFRVSLNRAAGTAVSVRYATEDGSAEAGADYVAGSGTLRFPAGSAAALPIAVTVHDDAVAESAETFVVRLSNAEGAALAAAAATGTITDNDTRALVVRPRELTVLEGRSARFEVALGSQPTGQVTVVLADGPELAVEPGELAFGTGDWQVAQPVTVTAQQDDDAAADAPVVLPIAARGGGYDGAQGSVRVTTAEDDAATLAVAGSRAAEGARRIRFAVTLSVASRAEVTASYATGAPEDSATAGEDYTAESGTVRFSAGSAGVRTIEVSVRDDTTDEPDEQVTVTLSNARNAGFVGGAATLTAAGVIEDDDDEPRVGIGDGSASEGAPLGAMRFTVALQPASGRVVTVRYATANLTAAAGSDYTAVSGTLTFAPGVREQTVTVPVANDTLDEDDEQFTVTLSTAVNATLDSGARTATGTITDDDDTPGLSIADARAQEDAGHLRFAVTLDHASARTVTVGFSTADGTAAAGSDYTAASGTLTFTAGARARTIAVPVTDDADDEEDESLTVTLQSPSHATLDDDRATGTIADNDDAVVAPPVDADPELSIDHAQAAEDAGPLRFAVTLDSAAAQAVTVNYATADGTASAGSDYTAANGTLTFAAGTLARTIAVAVTDDTAAEEEESLTVTLRSPSHASLADASATGIIIDDDGPADDHGDGQLTATTVAPATAAIDQEAIAGHLETNADEDYFRVVVNAGDTVHAAIDPSTQPENLAFRAIVAIESATYTSTNADGFDAAAVSSSTTVYVRVWSRNGTPRYDLAIWIPDSNDPADTTFDIDLVYPSATEPNTSRRATIRAAADKWEEVISAGLPAYPTVLSDMCGSGHAHDFGALVDDLVIEIRETAIDGAGGVWASAGLCAQRSSADGGLPAFAEIDFDTADLSRMSSAQLGVVALHEIGHALGFGTDDGWFDALENRTRDYHRKNPTSTTLPDAYFAGTAAVSAFNEIADSYTGGKVPVENDTQNYTEGSWDGHWRQSVFGGNEVMASTIESTARLSKVTIAALADLGYSVDYTEAESYTLPSSSAHPSRLPGSALPAVPRFRDEVRRGPVAGRELLEQEIPIIR